MVVVFEQNGFQGRQEFLRSSGKVYPVFFSKKKIVLCKPPLSACMYRFFFLGGGGERESNYISLEIFFGSQSPVSLGAGAVAATEPDSSESSRLM